MIFSRLNIKPASFDILTDDARSIQKIADGEAWTMPATIEDPKVLTKPWTSPPRQWSLHHEDLEEYYCTDNQEVLQYDVLRRNGRVGFELENPMTIRTLPLHQRGGCRFDGAFETRLRRADRCLARNEFGVGRQPRLTR